jgi:hypothetical protein
VVAELAVYPAAPGTVPDAGLATRLLRKVNVGQLAELFHAQAALEADQYADWANEIPEDSAVLMELAADTRQTTPPKTRPGRKGHGIDYHLDWAADYHEKVNIARVKNPIAELAREKGMTATAVRDTIAAVRRYGLLTKPPGRGRAGGELTTRALAMLAERGPNKEISGDTGQGAPRIEERDETATFTPATSLRPGSAVRCPYPGCKSKDRLPHQHPWPPSSRAMKSLAIRPKKAPQKRRSKNDGTIS